MEELRIKTAIDKKTIPELVYVEEDEATALDDLLKEEYEFSDLYSLVRESFPDVEPIDVARHYLMIKRKGFSRVKEVYDNQLQESQNEVANAIAGEVGKRTEYVAETMLSDNEIDEYEKSYEKRVKEFSEERKEVGSARTAMDRIPVPESTEPVVRRLFVTYESSDSTDALELFNRAEVSPRLPFLAAPPFYKIERHAPFSPPVIPETGGRVVGYVKQESGMYAMVALGPNEVVVESPDHNAGLESARAPQEEILSAVRSAFGMALSEPKQVKEELRVEYFFQGMDVHPILFKHFLFTDPVIRTFFFLDERVMVSRKKTYVYLHYYPTPDSDPINLMVSNAECGVRVYMSRCARSAVRDAMADVGRCLLAFRDKRKAIERELLPSAGVAGIISEKELNEEYDKQKKECVRKELTARDVWNTGSVSTQSVGFPPRLLRTADPATYRLLNPEDAPDPDRWANQTGDQEVLLFPKKGDTRFEQHYYTCPPEKHADRPHIGLQQVGDTVFPNCYKVKQDSVAAYRSGEEAKSSKVDYILTTGKVLRVKNQIGSMLPDLDRWMALTDPDRILYRYAYSDPSIDPASVLGLLNHALSIKEDVNQSRRRLAEAVSGDLLTEAVPYSVEELRRMASDPEGWIDPRIFYHALRRAYETEIVLFTKDENRSKSPFRITCPYYHYVYDEIPTRRYDRAVMVCVNTGGDRDRLPHPVCELVIAVPFDAKPPSAKLMAAQRHDLATSDPLYERFDEMVREWYGRTVRSHPFGAPTAQTLDTFGKVSWLHFGDVSIHLTIPIHSINVPVRKNETFGCSPEAANAWLAGKNAEVAERRAGSVRLGIVGSVKGQSFFLPFRRKEKLMDTYKKYEKVSRIMLEYVLYLFSTYLAEKGKEVEYETFVAFSREKFEIDPAVTYDVLPRKFSMDNSYLRGGKLRVGSELVRAKLMYSLRQECGLNPDAVREYHKREEMMNYYVYLSDFEERPNAIVLEGEESMRKYYEKRGDRGLPEGKKEIQIEAAEPYILYFSIPEIGVSRWLVQPVDSAERGVAVCEEWRRSGVNRPDKEPVRGEYTLIQWESETSYLLSGSGDRYVSWIHTPRGNVYQAMLPYM